MEMDTYEEIPPALAHTQRRDAVTRKPRLFWEGANWQRTPSAPLTRRPPPKPLPPHRKEMQCRPDSPILPLLSLQNLNPLIFFQNGFPNFQFLTIPMKSL
jgi:hypothetical protein